MLVPIVIQGDWMQLMFVEAESKEAALIQEATRWVNQLNENLDGLRARFFTEDKVILDPDGVTGQCSPELELKVLAPNSHVVESVWTVPDFERENVPDEFRNVLFEKNEEHMHYFDAIYDMDDFAKFAAEQPEVWTDGKPGIALPHMDETGLLIYCDEHGWSKIIERYSTLNTRHVTAVERFIEEKNDWIGQVALANDNLGLCQGVAFTTLWVLETDDMYGHGGRSVVDVVQLVFDHGIVEARRDSLELLAIRMLTRFDEL